MIKIIIIFLLLITCNSWATVIIQDDFEYEVGRATSDKSAFTSTGPWTAVKSLPAQSGACGYTYTTTSIPGYVGSFPGTSSSRVLVSEHLPYTNQCTVGGTNTHCPTSTPPSAWSGSGGNWTQSDTYLTFYGATQVIPATFYVQFWLYLQNYGTYGVEGAQVSRFTRGKFIYPCADNVGAGTCSTGHLDWLTVFSDTYAGQPKGNIDAGSGNTYIYIDTTGNAIYNGENELGVNQVSDANAKFAANTWYLVRIYHDFSTVNPTYRMWRRTAAESEFTLITEFIDGTTEGLTWTPYSTTGDYRINLLEMNDCHDAFWYMDDFILATDIGDLPSYTSTASTSIGGGSIKGGSF